MTIGRTKRESNQLDALRLMLRELGFGSIQVTLFDATATPFSDAIFRTTWEELESQGYVLRTGESRYRLSAKNLRMAQDFVNIVGGISADQVMGMHPDEQILLIGGALIPLNTPVEVEGGAVVMYLTTQSMDISVTNLSTTGTPYSLSVPGGVEPDPLKPSRSEYDLDEGKGKKG